MPIYEYQCSACGHSLEALQKISEDPLKHCPACQQECLVKQLSAPSFRLSGTGWYETDFKKDKRKNISGDTETPAANDNGKTESDSAAADKKVSAPGKDSGATSTAPKASAGE